MFALLSRDNYSWDELQQRPLPDGVDPSRLEKYLNDDDFVVRNFLAIFLKSVYNKLCFKNSFWFQKYLGLSREDFNAAPRWKQLEIRKEKGLFWRKKTDKKFCLLLYKKPTYYMLWCVILLWFLYLLLHYTTLQIEKKAVMICYF